MRRNLFWLGFFVILALGAASLALEYFGHRAGEDVARKVEIPPMPLEHARDGTWRAQAGVDPYAYKIWVTVGDHRLTGIGFADEKSKERMPRAQTLFDRVLEKQSLKVTLLEGAEFQSVLLLKAISRAVTRAAGDAAVPGLAPETADQDRQNGSDNASQP